MMNRDTLPCPVILRPFDYTQGRTLSVAEGVRLRTRTGCFAQDETSFMLKTIRKLIYSHFFAENDIYK